MSATLIVLGLLACAATPEPRRPAAGDCLEIGVYSNGFHTSLTLPREALNADHPLRRLFPDARWLVIGWGDEDFFREPGGGTVGQGVRAIFPGGPTVLHVIALDVTPERYFAAGDTPHAAVTHAGAAQLARYIDREIVRSPEGDTVVVAPGQHPGRSYFLRARDETFSLFNNCNHWAARGLRAASLPIPGAVTAREVVNRVEAVGSSCPAS